MGRAAVPAGEAVTDRARGLAAAAGLLVAVGGVPAIITVLAGGPPSTIPAWHQVVRALGQPITDHALLRAVAVVAWALWLLFAAAVALEALAFVRHRPGPSATRTGLRIPGLQGLAGSLVLAAVVALPSRAPPAMAAGVASPSMIPAAATASLMTAHVDPLQMVAGSPALVAPAAAVPAGVAPSAFVRYRVVRYDSPWEIAERHLGNGLRWREIVDDTGASLVVEPPLAAGPSEESSPGEASSASARIIYPGQVLLLPPDAAGIPGTEAAGPPVGAGPAPVTTATPVAPVTVWTGEATAVGTEEPFHAEQGTPSPGGGTHPEAVQASGLTPTPASHSPVVPLSELLLGAGLVASATMNVIHARRARQAGHARRDERVPLPDLALRRTELALRGARTDHVVTATHRAVAALASDLARAGQAPPLIGGVLAHDDAIEVLLAQPATPPPPWQAVAGGRHWRMAMTDIPVGSDGNHPELLPGLVPIGRETGSGSEVLLNLEASAVTGVSGSPETAAGLVHGAAVALAGLPWARSADVILVGFGHLLAGSQPHMRVASSVADIGDELRAVAEASASRLRATGATHIAAGRLVDGADGLTPTIIVAPNPPSGDEINVLAEVCRHDTAITALVAGDIAAPRMLRTETNPFSVPDLHITVTPSILPGSELAAVNQILSVALSASGVGPDTAPYDGLVSGERSDESSGAHLPGSEAVVVVEVLGPVEVNGAGEFRRPHAKEAAVYLAMHPRGVAEHQLDEAIWPERHLVKATTRDPVVSATRTALGGPDRMPHAQGQGPDKRYRITDRVGSDWQRFCALHAHGRQARAIGPLRAALDLVRGRPFADVVAGPGYGWLHLEGHLHHMEAEVVDAADLAGELFLEQGDPVAARWATNRGLAVSPYAERLWVRLMAVADALGEAQEVEHILVEMNRRLDLDGDYSQLHPDTIDAYHRYSRRNDRRRAG
ncbi:MAG: bacterial transcriptional activator domain-containing protein [Actinomycetota bacterium]|nr:bacterial transcriptional activator domain-containing protein [Actinomycetota bacterium]